MKKRVILAILLVLLILAPVTAASYRGSEKNGTVGVGLNVGTNTGLGLKFGMGDFDILANVGLSNFSITKIAGDVAVSYQVYDFNLGRGHHMPLTVGVGATTALDFGNNSFGFDLAVIVPVGISYQLKDIPLQFYLRLAPGIQLFKTSEFGVDFAFAGYLGALWMF